MVTEYDWEHDTFTHNVDHPARQAFRQAVAEIADKARQTLPECNGRVDAAVKIVLAGDVELLEGGKGKVASQANGTTVYHLVDGQCTCKDFPRSPSGWCKHRIALGLMIRAQARLRAQADSPAPTAAEVARSVGDTTSDTSPAPDASTALPAVDVPPILPLPEVPAIVSTVLAIEGQRVEVKLCDTDDTRLLQRLTRLLTQYPSEPVAVTTPTADTQPCPIHGVPMALNHKNGRSWYSHKTATGWCKGR
jgi:hypothetical protein